jgi:hemerythrin superfamily protein
MPQAQGGNSFGRLATGAALGLFAGLALPAARKAVLQGPSIAAGDWMDGLIAEHKAVEKSFQELLKTGQDETAKRELLLSKIAHALTKHSIEEESVIYPALSEHGHADQARRSVEDHAQVKTFIFDLRRIPSTDARWMARAHDFWAALEAHIRLEESEIFPAFREQLSVDENSQLTKMMNWEGFKAA